MGCCCSDSKKSSAVEERRFLDGNDASTVGNAVDNRKRSSGSITSNKQGVGGKKVPKNSSFDKQEGSSSHNGKQQLPKPGNSSSLGAITTVTNNSTCSANGAGVGSCRGSALDRLPLFQKLAYIGQGSFAEVTLARKIKTGNLYAMKKIRKKLIEERGEIEHTVTERRLLGELQHPFLVQLHESFQSQQCLYLLLSYAAGGDCHALLSRNPRQSLKATFFYVYEISLALEFLHQSGFLYRDLKPENILIDELGHVLLTDFGVAKKMDAERTASFCGTLLYAAPEVHKNEGQTYAVDWWSLGCFIFEMINGRRPFDSDTGGEMQQIRAIVEKDVVVREGEDFVVKDCDYSTDEEKAEAASAMEALRDLTLQFLCRNPAKRLGGADVFLQPFFHHRYFSLVYADSLGQTPSENWMEVIEGRGLTPPFQPTLASSVDVQYFTQACPVVASKRLSMATNNQRSASTSVATVGNTSMQSHTLAPYFDVDDDGALMLDQACGVSSGGNGAGTTQGAFSSNTSYGRPTEGGQSTPSPGQHSFSPESHLDSGLNQHNRNHSGSSSHVNGNQRNRHDSSSSGRQQQQHRDPQHHQSGLNNDEESDNSESENDLTKYRAEQEGNGQLSNLSYAEEDRPTMSMGSSPPSRYYHGYTFKEQSTLHRGRK